MHVLEAFDDLLAANRRYARSAPKWIDGVAQEGVLVLTCMDSRLEPLSMIGMRVGEAVIQRSAGGRLTDAALAAMVIAVHRLKVDRILVIPHTRCGAAALTEEEMGQAITATSGIDATDIFYGVDSDQIGRLHDDVNAIRSHPLIGPFAKVGGFMYDVDTGLLEQIC